MSADKACDIERRRYDRFAPAYDACVAMAEKFRLAGWRKILWSKAEGQRILEVGVGTGSSFPCYPDGVEVTGIDLSSGMLKRAEARARRRNLKVDLRVMDVHHLEFEDDTFDTVVTSLVFCSVPKPVRGLQEIHRVLKPGGKAVFMEHMVSSNRVLACWMRLWSPLVMLFSGDKIDQRTIEHIGESGLRLKRVTDLGAWGIFKLIEAEKNS